eukprot:6201186-Pleurochrysis_carterae.AAC.1
MRRWSAREAQVTEVVPRLRAASPCRFCAGRACTLRRLRATRSWCGPCSSAASLASRRVAAASTSATAAARPRSGWLYATVTARAPSCCGSAAPSCCWTMARQTRSSPLSRGAATSRRYV